MTSTRPEADATDPAPTGRPPFTDGWTLRRKLVASILALFVALTIATSVATVLTLRQSLNDELDRKVGDTLNAMTQLERREPSGLPRPSGERDRPGPFGDGLLVRVSAGTVVDAGAAGPDRTWTTLTENQVTTLLSAGLSNRPASIDLGGQLGGYRVAAAQSSLAGDIVVIGLPEQQLDETVRRMAFLTGGFGVIGLALVGAGSWWLVRANLRPLQRVADTATRVSRLPLSSGEVDVAERVPASDTDRRTEVGQVGAALNELLDHVDTSLQARHRSETQLRQFVADASHELRTPLASIKGYAELSRKERDPMPTSITHALGRIESEATRMTALVEDLLLLARLDAGRPLERRPVDLTMLVIDAVSDLRAAGPDHVWRLDLPEEAVEALGDQQRLTQVVVNLLNNARVHTPGGTTVTARVRREGAEAVAEVQDDGPGIDADLLSRVFARFTRGDSARVRSGGSTGLGLSIVEAVTAAHGGNVTVESVPGRTVFGLRLPAADPPAVGAA